MASIAETVSLLSGLVGLIVTAFHVWKSVFVQGLFRRPTWRAVENMVTKIHDDMQDYVPNVIVGVGRGGAIAAAMISNRFREPIPIIVLSVNHREKGEPLFEHCEPKAGIDNVLVVTATANRGTSTKRVVEKLRANGAEHIKTACLVKYTDATPDLVDFFGKHRARRQLFPWMMNPTLFWSRRFE